MDKTPHINLRLRVFDDGGPLYRFLAGISEPSSRNERMRQLGYLGTLAEAGKIAASPTAHLLPGAANAALFTSSLASDSRRGSQRVIDLHLHLCNDGGPLFHLLANTPCGPARNERALLLMYVGVLVESGVIAGRPTAQLQQAAANTAKFGEGPVVVNRQSTTRSMK